LRAYLTNATASGTVFHSSAHQRCVALRLQKRGGLKQSLGSAAYDTDGDTRSGNEHTFCVDALKTGRKSRLFLAHLACPFQTKKAACFFGDQEKSGKLRG
jgi:hypothetical protein